jgi:hypothetical protein
VWHTGQELTLSGIALDRETDADGQGWGITDGSAGLRGRLIKTDDLAEIKLFAATFLSGAAGAFTQQQPTIYGNEITPTLENAPLTGAQSVLQAYAQQILNSIERDGFYVRVPAGKQFYLYVTQTIDVSDAGLGETRLNPVDTQPSPATNRISTIPVPATRFGMPFGRSTQQESRHENNHTAPPAPFSARLCLEKTRCCANAIIRSGNHHPVG